MSKSDGFHNGFQEYCLTSLAAAVGVDARACAYLEFLKKVEDGEAAFRQKRCHDT